MARISALEAGGHNVVAFLDMLAASTHSMWVLDHSDDGYNVLEGSHGPIEHEHVYVAQRLLTFRTYETFPPLDGVTVSEAGRYQLAELDYWRYAERLGLDDFSPLSQDRIAVEQMRERHALPLIQSGHIGTAIAACANVWPHLSPKDFGNDPQRHALLMTAYRNAGGTVAIG